METWTWSGCLSRHHTSIDSSMTLTWGQIDFIFQHHRVYVSTHLDRETLCRPNYVASFSRSKVVCRKPFLPKKVTLKFRDPGWLNRRCRLKITRSWIEDRFRTIYCLFPFPASSRSAKDWGQTRKVKRKIDLRWPLVSSILTL